MKVNILKEHESHLSKYIFSIRKKSWCAEFSFKCSPIKNVLTVTMPEPYLGLGFKKATQDF